MELRINLLFCKKEKYFGCHFFLFVIFSKFICLNKEIFFILNIFPIIYKYEQEKKKFLDLK